MASVSELTDCVRAKVFLAGLKVLPENFRDDQSSPFRFGPLGRQPFAQSQLNAHRALRRRGRRQAARTRAQARPARRAAHDELQDAHQPGGLRRHRHARAIALSAMQGISRGRQGRVRRKTADARERRIQTTRGTRREA